MTDIVANTDRTFEEFRRDEEIVTNGLNTACIAFYEIGAALTRIRDSRSYLHSRYRTFEEYCKKQFGIGRSHVYRLIDAAAVYANLAPPRGDENPQLSLSLPNSEAHCRPLAQLTSDQQKAVWAIAAGDAKSPTPSGIKAAIATVTGNQSQDSTTKKKSMTKPTEPRPHDPDIDLPLEPEPAPTVTGFVEVEATPAPEPTAPQFMEVEVTPVPEPTATPPGTPPPAPKVATVLQLVDQLTFVDRATVLAYILKYQPHGTVYNQLVEYLLKCGCIPPVERVRFINQITEHLSEDDRMSIVQHLLVQQPDASVAELVLILLERVPEDYVKQVAVKLKQARALPATPSR
jgi:hypothetical protein